MTRVLLLPTLLLLFLGSICYVLSARVAPTGTSAASRPIVFATSDDVRTLDPGKVNWMTDIRVVSGLFEGLTNYKPVTLEPIPGVAQSWDISSDRLTYTFHLRPDAKWSNGDPVTAQDFVYAWQRVLLPSTGSQYVELFYCIRGVKPYVEAIAEEQKKRRDAPPPDPASLGFSAPDARTLIVTLENPTSYFLDLAGFPTFFPVHKKTVGRFLLDPAKPYMGDSGGWNRPPHLISNGPYRLDDWKFRDYLALVPNPEYWDRPNVRCDRLIIKPIPKDERAALLAFQTGTVDILSFIPQPEDILEAKDWKFFPSVHCRPVFGSYYFNFNCTRPPLNDPRVRKALSLAIDRQDIVENVTHQRQKPLGLIVPPDSIPGYTSPDFLPIKGNVAEAKRLLAEAGFPDGKGFRSIEILYSTDLTHHGRTAQAIGQMWKRNLNIDTTLRALERSGFSQAKQEDHNFDVARGGWYGDYPDPTTWLDLCRSTNGNNDGLYKNPAFDALLDKAAAELDAAKRLALLRQAESMLVNDELPLIPLYQYSDGFVFDDTKILGNDVNVRLITTLKDLHRAP